MPNTKYQKPPCASVLSFNHFYSPVCFLFTASYCEYSRDRQPGATISTLSPSARLLFYVFLLLNYWVLGACVMGRRIYGMFDLFMFVFIIFAQINYRCGETIWPDEQRHKQWSAAFSPVKSCRCCLTPPCQHLHSRHNDATWLNWWYLVESIIVCRSFTMLLAGVMWVSSLGET